MAKQTIKEVINDKAQNLLNAVALWGAFYRANPHRFAKDFLNLNLRLFQKINLYEMMHNVNTIYLASRGQGFFFFFFCNNISASNTKILGGTVNKYTYNENYFEIIDTPDKAYWLGFLYADGCVHESYNKDKTKIKSMRLVISLCESDYCHLEKFKKCIGTNIPIKKRSTTLNGKTFYHFQIIICCTKLCRDLINKGCTPRKTYTIKFPSSDIVPHEFMNDFLRGLFDGDGCLNYVPKVRFECNITGMKNMLSDTNDYLLSNNIISKQLKIYDRKNSLACEMWLYGDTCKSFLDYIYKDSKIYLDRKYNKYLQYCNDHQRIMKKGVYWSDSNKAYIVTISIHSKRIRIGQYKNYEDAVKARKEAEIIKLQNSQALLVSND